MLRGELSTGAFGEGYVDRRHPHTYLHELIASGIGSTGPLAYSASFGRGFVPYGTDDPMMRPFEKYPINHHLSQILERGLAIGALRLGRVDRRGEHVRRRRADLAGLAAARGPLRRLVVGARHRASGRGRRGAGELRERADRPSSRMASDSTSGSRASRGGSSPAQANGICSPSGPAPTSTTGTATSPCLVTRRRWWKAQRRSDPWTSGCASSRLSGRRRSERRIRSARRGPRPTSPSRGSRAGERPRSPSRSPGRPSVRFAGIRMSSSSASRPHRTPTRTSSMRASFTANPSGWLRWEFGSDMG